MMNTGPSCTLDDVAAELGISRERARQIEVKALRKLREELARRGLSFEDLMPDVESHEPEDERQAP